MTGPDAEIETFRRDVSCAALLEGLPPPWKLDHSESTRRALKYRRGAGEILIVNHEGRGWWDPTGTAKGDVFDLVQHLEPRLNFGQVRQVLRRFAGVAASYPAALRRRRDESPTRLPERWTARPRLRPRTQAWGYLTTVRRLPPPVLAAAMEKDVVRDGIRGSAWFAHREEGRVCHVEVRGPDFKGSLCGGRKSLFRLLAASGPTRRLVLTEAPIDALSLAALEGLRPDTLYAATGGGMGPGTIQAIEQLLATMASLPDALLASATDANPAGDAYAARHAALAAEARVPFARLRPTIGVDWNDVLKERGP